MKKLNFGCGKKILNGYTNVDSQKAEGIDNSFNFEKFPYPFKENTFDYVLADNVFEHFQKPEKVIQELWRICKKNAIIHIKVPYWNNSVAYNDPDHKHYYNARSFEIICDINSEYKHKVKRKFEIIKIVHVPGNIKKRIPKLILNFLDKFLHGIFIELDVEIRVLK